MSASFAEDLAGLDWGAPALARFARDSDVIGIGLIEPQSALILRPWPLAPEWVLLTPGDFTILWAALNERRGLLRRSFVEGSSTVTLEDSGRFGLFAERLCLERPLTAEQGSLAWLVRCGALPSLVAEQLGQAVRAGRSLVVTGETGSGKSMLLHTLLAEVSAETRSVIVEEDESSWQTRATASPTLARFVPSSALSWEECLQSALALAPDLLVVGELRNWTASLGIRAAARQRGALGAQAALVLELEALKAATKRRGTLANPIRPALLGTVNARDAQGAIRRIAALAAGDDSRQDQSMEEIRTEVRSAIDFIVVMSRNGGQNRVSQVALVFPQTLEILYTREEDGP